MTRNDDQYVTRIIEAVGEIGVHREVRRESDVREILPVLAIGGHRLEQVQLHDAAEPHVAAHPGKLDGQRGSPGTGTDNS